MDMQMSSWVHSFMPQFSFKMFVFFDILNAKVVRKVRTAARRRAVFRDHLQPEERTRQESKGRHHHVWTPAENRLNYAPD